MARPVVGWGLFPFLGWLVLALKVPCLEKPCRTGNLCPGHPTLSPGRTSNSQGGCPQPSRFSVLPATPGAGEATRPLPAGAGGTRSQSLDDKSMSGARGCPFCPGGWAGATAPVPTPALWSAHLSVHPSNRCLWSPDEPGTVLGSEQSRPKLLPSQSDKGATAPSAHRRWLRLPGGRCWGKGSAGRGGPRTQLTDGTNGPAHTLQPRVALLTGHPAAPPSLCFLGWGRKAESVQLCQQVGRAAGAGQEEQLPVGQRGVPVSFCDVSIQTTADGSH